jgi:hypothetical protein
MASGPYLRTLEKILDGYFGSGTWRAMLLNGYTENRDTHEFLTSARSSEIANGNGYDTDGKALTPTVGLNTTTNTLTITFPQVVWTTATISATHCLYYKELGTDSQDELGFVNNFGGTVTSTNDDFTVPAGNFTWDFPDTD